MSAPVHQLPLSRLALNELLLARLRETGLTVFDGEVPAEPPVIAVNGTPDPSGRVAAYVVVRASAGVPELEADVADEHVDLLWTFQTTVAAGYHADALYAVDRVSDQLYRWSPEVADAACDRCNPPPGFDPGPMRRDDDVNPPRFWLPQQWQLRVTR